MARPKSPKKLDAVKPATAPVTDSVIPAAPVAVTTAMPVNKAEAISAVPTATTVPVASAAKPAAKASASVKTSTSGKMGIVKTDARATVLPIDLEEEIRRLAYLFSERRGFAPGHEAEDWLAAETEIRQRYHQQSSAVSA